MHRLHEAHRLSSRRFPEPWEVSLGTDRRRVTRHLSAKGVGVSRRRAEDAHRRHQEDSLMEEAARPNAILVRHMDVRRNMDESGTCRHQDAHEEATSVHRLETRRRRMVSFGALV